MSIYTKIKEALSRHPTFYTATALVVFTIIVYKNWLTGSIFTHSDWGFLYTYGSDFNLSLTTWVGGGMGQMNTFLFRVPYDAVLNFFLQRGFAFADLEKILVFWPSVILVTLSSFFFVKYITKNNTAAVIGSLIFSYNTYYLSIDPEGHIMLFYAAGFALLSIPFYLKVSSGHNNHKINQLVICSLLLALSGVIDFRVAYITFSVLLAYAIYFSFPSKKEVLRQIKYMSILGGIFALLNLFWVIPFVMTGAAHESSLLNSGLFGDQYWNILNAFTAHHPFWTGAETSWFTLQPIPLYAWILPIFFVVSLYVSRNKDKNIRKYIYFFSFVALVGIFLSKQSDGPFSSLYVWLYYHFPGFNAFREGTKFYYLTLLGYSVVIGSLFTPSQKAEAPEKEHTNTENTKRLKVVGFLMIIVWALCNTLPYLDSSIGKLLAPKQIPSDYVVFKNLIDSEDSDFRVLAVPKTSRWMNNSINNPDVNIADLTGDTWASFTDASNTNPQATMLSALNQPFSNKLLDMSSVKYLVVPILDTANDDNFFIYFGGDRQIFVDALSKVRFLKRIDSGTQELAVFENADYRPHVYTTATMESASTTVPYKEVSYTMLEPTQYKVTLTNLSRPTQVNFSENFHPDWKVRVGYFDWWSAIWNRHYFMPDEFHYENNAKLNSFMVDPSYIKQNFSPGSYSQNSDGSINVEITIYFKPQSYLYLGLLISAATFILCLACLGYWVIKRRSKLSIIKHENT